MNEMNEAANLTSDPFWKELREKYLKYLQTIADIGFAAIEVEQLPKDPKTPEELCDGICRIMEFCKELNLIVDQSPTSIYVSNAKGKTIRVNKYFEESSGLSRKEIQGRVNLDLEKETLYEPSVGAIALNEGRRVIIPQVMNHDREFIVAGMPIKDEKDEVFCVVTNALLNFDTHRISHYFETRNEERTNNVPVVPKIIAVSEKMQDILRLADIIKNTPSTILLEGETGVGKSLLARYIHFTGDRKDGKMTEINCGAIPQALLESELFGYVSGAFTGADRKGKAGLIEASDGGTILLDEIGELPLLLQVKLLHFLQNRKITRVGGTEEIPVNVRVIAATNRNLEKLVEEGEFREDLFYRLNVVPIEIPPLRERKEDIIPAVRYFAEKYAALYGKELHIDDSDISRYEQRPWKGNLRELENYIERIIVTEGSMMSETNGDAREEWTVRKSSEDSSGGKGNGSSAGKGNRSSEERPDESDERERILEAYHRLGSSYKVAKELGLSQSTAYRKIKKYLGQ